MRWLLILIMMIWPTAAQAEDQAHRIAFSEGRYSDAASAANVAHTPDNLAFAARSLLAEAMSAEDFIPPPDLIDQAAQLARDALLEAPEHVEARLQLAIALSLKTRPMTTRQTLRSGYGDEAKRLVESVLEDDPTNVYAHGFLSVWHIEVRRRGGAIGASMMGASVKKGRKHYQEAVALSPDDASVHWQYARALAALNARKYRSEISQVLAAADACVTDTKLERLMQARARSLQSVLQSEKRSVTERLAAEML
jgi:hypothetical protein